jgi:hypothetical protein
MIRCLSRRRHGGKSAFWRINLIWISEAPMIPAEDPRTGATCG